VRDGQGPRFQLPPRRSGVYLFGGEEYGPVAVPALRAGAVGTVPPKVLLGLEAPDAEPFHTGEPEGVEEVAVGEEKVQAGVSAVLHDPTHGFPDAGEGVRGLPEMVAKEGEVSLEVGITLERAQRDRKVL
jgi:hypothetical protein